MVRERNEYDESNVDYLKLIRTLLSKLHIIVFFGLLCGVLTYAVVYWAVTPEYEAGIMLYVNNASSKDGNTNISQSDLTAASKLVDTYSAIITSKTFLEQVITEAEVEIEADKLEKKISAESVNDTEVFCVSVTYEDPKAATRIANAIGKIAPSQIAAIVDGSSVKVIDYAGIPTEISAPNYRKCAGCGIVFGLILSMIVILIRDFTDTTIKSEADLEEWEVPVLGVVPDFAEAKKQKTYGYATSRVGNKS